MLSISDLETRFKQRDFEVSHFIANVAGLGNEAISQTAANLEDLLTQLQTKLNGEVVLCHERLLDNTFSLELLDRELLQVRENVNEMRRSMSQIQEHSLEPFAALKKKVKLLSRAQEVNILVRKYSKFEFDLKKLRAHVNSQGQIQDYAASSSSLYELERLLEEEHYIHKIGSLKSDILWIQEQGVFVRRKAEEDLKIGLRDYNQQLVDLSTQTFFNLHSLWDILLKIIGEILGKLEERLPFGGSGRTTTTTTSTTLNPSTYPSTSNLGTFSTSNSDLSLQTLMEPFIAQASTACRQIHFLDSILLAKSDPISHKRFSTESLLDVFWKKLFTEILTDRVNNCSTSVRAALITEFPRLSKLLQYHLVETLDIQSFTLKKQLFGSVEILHSQYIESSLARLTTPVEQMLPESVINSFSTSGFTSAGGLEANISNLMPTPADIKTFVEILSGELQRSETGANFLIESIVRNIRTVVLLLVQRLESLTDSEGLLANGNTFTQGHSRNAGLFVLVSHLQQLILQNLSKVLSSQLTQHIKSVQRGFLDPFFQTISMNFRSNYYGPWKQAIMGVNQASDNVNPQNNSVIISPSMERFVQCIHSISTTYIINFASANNNAMAHQVSSLCSTYSAEILRFILFKILLGENGYEKAKEFYGINKLLNPFVDNTTMNNTTMSSTGGVNKSTAVEAGRIANPAEHLILDLDLIKHLKKYEASRERLSRDLEMLDRGVRSFIACGGLTVSSGTINNPNSTMVPFELHIIRLLSSVLDGKTKKSTLLEHLFDDVALKDTIEKFLDELMF